MTQSRFTSLIFTGITTGIVPTIELCQLWSKKHQLPALATISPSNLTVLSKPADKSNISISAIRQLQTDLSYHAYSQSSRVCIIWQAELLQREAQNALLKLLEEPPASTQIILATNFPQQLLPTIRSRCQIINLNESEDALSDTTTTKEILDQLLDPHTDYSQIMELLEPYSQRESALLFVDQVLALLLHQEDFPSAMLTQIASQLLLAKQKIAGNVNPKLTLEDCFFMVKGGQSR